MKKYTLKTIEDIANVVTEKNYKCLMLDISSCFRDYLLMKEKYPELKMKHLTWKDDNTVGVTGIDILNKKGKLKKRFKFKLPKK